MTGLAELERRRLPVLTEVVELPPDALPATHAEPPVPAPVEPAAEWRTRPPAVPAAEPSPRAPPPAEVPADAPAIDADALAQQVLAALQPRLDAWFEARVRDALAPALDRLAHGVAAEARDALGVSLRALVARTVAEVLDERRARR